MPTEYGETERQRVSPRPGAPAPVPADADVQPRHPPQIPGDFGAAYDGHRLWQQ